MQTLAFDANTLVNDLVPFADLGDSITVTRDDSTHIGVEYHQDSELIYLLLRKNDGRVEERRESNKRVFKSFRQFISSENYANLIQWSQNQATLLKSKANITDPIPIDAKLDEALRKPAAQAIGEALSTKEPAGIHLVLLDGPAGIGKTALIERISFEKAQAFPKTGGELLLHIESHGKVLQNINDLIAVSLQKIRSRVRYDQVPVLVKHGAVVLAIDGFDELGDPNGYDLAWGAMNELLKQLRGDAKLILAGRETFIGQQRVSRSLTSLKEEDTIAVVSLLPVKPNDAQEWLATKGWTESMMSGDHSAALFTEASYALRPFFLSILAEPEIAELIAGREIRDTLAYLVNLMLEREQTKFGPDISATSTRADRMQFIRDIASEAARDMADNQTDLVSDNSLIWLSDAYSDRFDENVRGILRNRVEVLGFFTKSEKNNQKRFVHDNLYNYFLSVNLAGCLIQSEFPKYLRRNIFDSSFLNAFMDYAQSIQAEDLDLIVDVCTDALDKFGNSDRTRQNLAVVLFGIASVGDVKEFRVSGVHIDEAFFRGVVSKLVVINSFMNKISADSADLRAVTFKETTLTTLKADTGFVPSTTFPQPKILELPGKSFTTPRNIEAWFGQQFYSAEGAPSVPDFLGDILDLPMLKLLARLSRYRPYWLASSDDPASAKILEHPDWPKLLELLKKHDFISVRDDVPAAGPRTRFYHVRRKEILQRMQQFPKELRSLFADIIRFEADRMSPEP